MKVTDYIIEYLIARGVTDIFGYPGGVICHLIDSATKYKNELNAHALYHEQGAAFAACGYAQASGKVGVAYATSGPGATNLVTGIANAYFDSIPSLYITGQVDTYALKGTLPIRQRGFQETNVVSIVQEITKYAVLVDSPEKIKYYLEKAYYIAKNGNPGPVLLDIPADIQRAEVDVKSLKGFNIPEEEKYNLDELLDVIATRFNSAKRACIIVGNGVKQTGLKESIRSLIENLNIPAVFSMPAFDLLPYEHPLNFGFIGANGHRYANFVLGKSDLILSIGSRLDIKQVGIHRNQFAKQARIIRIDIDVDSFAYHVHEDELQLKVDIKALLPYWLKKINKFNKCRPLWVDVCGQIKECLNGYDDAHYNRLITKFGELLPDSGEITADVGQSSVWLAQSLRVKENQQVYFSAGHGAMGYSLPAAIGVYYAQKAPVYCFNGDGGIQMNLQELQFVKREKLPIKVIVINNFALGMIRGFQEANFNMNYAQTISCAGYSAADFEKIAYAYDLPYTRIEREEDLIGLKLDTDKAELIEIVIEDDTNLIPNFGVNGLIQDQRPYLDRHLFDKLMGL